MKTRSRRKRMKELWRRREAFLWRRKETRQPPLTWTQQYSHQTCRNI